MSPCVAVPVNIITEWDSIILITSSSEILLIVTIPASASPPPPIPPPIPPLKEEKLLEKGLLELGLLKRTSSEKVSIVWLSVLFSFWIIIWLSLKLCSFKKVTTLFNVTSLPSLKTIVKSLLLNSLLRKPLIMIVSSSLISIFVTFDKSIIRSIPLASIIFSKSSIYYPLILI